MMMATHKVSLSFKPEPLMIEQSKMPLWALLHRQAGIRGYSATPKRSHVSGRCQAEVNYTEATGRVVDGIPTYRTSLNVKLGTGDSPIEAAAHGYSQVMSDPVMLCLYLEVEAWRLAEAVRLAMMLERALADLQGLIA